MRIWLHGPVAMDVRIDASWQKNLIARIYGASCGNAGHRFRGRQSGNFFACDPYIQWTGAVRRDDQTAPDDKIQHESFPPIMDFRTAWFAAVSALSSCQRYLSERNLHPDTLVPRYLQNSTRYRQILQSK